MRMHFAGAVLAAMIAVPPVGYAADLGGNCCSDLEERVAELEATTARKGNRKLSLRVSGHVNQAVGDTLRIGENSNSLSRFRFDGSARINSTVSAGFLIEIGVPNSGEMDVRHNMLYLRMKGLGTISLGKTSQASDGKLEYTTASNEAMTMGSLGQFGALLSSANFAPSPFNLNVNINPLLAFDGGRTSVIKYTSPAVAGFVLSASWAGDGSETWDVALAFEKRGIAKTFDLVAAVFHRNEGGNTRKVSGGSASLRHITSGLFVDGMFAKSTGVQTIGLTFGIGGVNASFAIPVCNCGSQIWGVRAGIHKKWNQWGKTLLAVHYQDFEISSLSVNGERYGGSIEQNVDAIATTFYFDVSQISGSVGGASAEATVGILGAKIRF